jgi:hypothetical protein
MFVITYNLFLKNWQSILFTCDNEWIVRPITGNVPNEHALVLKVGLVGWDTVIGRVVHDVSNAGTAFVPHEP